MSVHDIKPTTNLEKLAKSLYSNGFDHTYIYKRLRALSDDPQLTNEIIDLVQQNQIAQEARALTMSERMNIVSDSYIGVFVGVFLILFGFLVKAFVAMAGLVSALPYVIMVLGMIIAMRHFVK